MTILYIAGVSISENPSDISPETLKILKECSLAIGEERKISLKFLSLVNATNKPLFLLNEHSEDKERRDILEALQKVKSAIFFSDAGTPCVSDPDASFIAMAKGAGVEIKSLPGPSSITTAISVSGINAKTFYFAGFPPREKEKRVSYFEKIDKAKETVVFMERPYSLSQTLNDMRGLKRKISLSLNLGSEKEKNYFDTPKNLIDKDLHIKAPFVIVVPPL